MEIPKSVIELVPESVARENVILPLSLEGNQLKIITPTRRTTRPSKSSSSSSIRTSSPSSPFRTIQEAINRNYGQTETESVDSMSRRVHRYRDRVYPDESVASLANADDSDAPVVKLCKLDHPGGGHPSGLDIHIEPFSDRVRIRYRNRRGAHRA